MSDEIRVSRVPARNRNEVNALVVINGEVKELTLGEVRRLQYELDRLFPRPVDP
jgi:hypothetical protein